MNALDSAIHVLCYRMAMEHHRPIMTVIAQLLSRGEDLGKVVHCVMHGREQSPVAGRIANATMHLSQHPDLISSLINNHDNANN